MSTRSNIIINFKNIVWSQFYHHCDGYPEGVGRMLSIATWYTRFHLGYIADETEYPLKLYEALKKALPEVHQEFEFEMEYLPYDEAFKHSLHGDIEYLYVVDIQCENRDADITVKYIPVDPFSEEQPEDETLIEKCLQEGTELTLQFVGE